MGPGSFFLRCLCIVALLSTVAGHAIAQSTVPSIGYVKTTSGSAMIVRNGQRTDAAAGTPLFEKDVLETGGDGALGVTLKDNTLLSLGPNSKLALESYVLQPDRDDYSFITSITRGTVQYVSGLIAKLSPDSVQIKTPVATLGVRGTRLLIKVAPDGD